MMSGIGFMHGSARLLNGTSAEREVIHLFVISWDACVRSLGGWRCECYSRNRQETVGVGRSCTIDKDAMGSAIP